MLFRSVERHNLTSNPQAFVDSTTVNEMLMKDGVDVLPITVLDGEVVKVKEYPTNDELVNMLEIPEEYIMSELQARKERNKTQE